MRPRLAIRQFGPCAYRYAVDTGRALSTPADSAFAMLEFSALEECLADAGDALAAYFSRVELQFGGRYLGSCSVEALRKRPAWIATRIREAFALAA